MTSLMYDKTDKGREEIATRKHHLPPRLRTLLLLIDGKHSTASLLGQLGGLGLTEQNLAELQENGFIQPTAGPAQHSAPAAVAKTASRASASHMKARDATALFEGLLPDGQTQFQAIYHFYLETIKSMIGLRGYALQHKVERAATVPELRELRQAYFEALQKTKGPETASSLVAQLDALLYYGGSELAAAG